MRRLITYFNSLLLGLTLGMIFVAIVESSPYRHEGLRIGGIMISYQVLGTEQQKSLLLFAGNVRPADRAPQFCTQSVDRGYRLASPVIAISIARVSPARLQQACSLKK